MKTKILAIATIFILTLTIITTQAQASGLTQTQINAIIGLLQSFGADQQVINNVRAALQGNGNSYSYTQTSNTQINTTDIVGNELSGTIKLSFSGPGYYSSPTIIAEFISPQKYSGFKKIVNQNSVLNALGILNSCFQQLKNGGSILIDGKLKITSKGLPNSDGLGTADVVIYKIIDDSGLPASLKACRKNAYTTFTSNNEQNACIQPYTLQRNLYLGTKGEDVAELQNYLRKLGFYTYPEITGYYGPATQQAVQRFQCSKMGICSGTPWTTGYGVVGPATREKMRCDYPSADTNNLGGPIIYNIKTQTYPSGFPSRVVTFGYDRMPRNVYKVALVSNSKGAVYLSDIRPTGGHLALQVPETAPAGVYHLNVFDSKNNLLLRSEDFVLTKSSHNKTISPKIIEFKLAPFNITPGQPFIATWVTQGNVRQCNITEVTGPTYYNVGVNGSKTLTTTVRHGLTRFRLSCVTNDNRSIYADANVLLDDSNINSSYNVTNDELTMYHIGACGISLSFFKGADLQEECSKQGSETSFILRNGGYILKGNFLVQDLDILSNDNNLGNHDKLKLAAFNLGVQMGINIWEEMKKQIKNDSAVLYHYENDIYSDTIFKSQNNKKVAVLILREYKREKVDVLLTLEPQYGQNTNYEILTNISKKILNSMAITKSTMSEVQLHKWLKDAMQ